MWQQFDDAGIVLTAEMREKFDTYCRFLTTTNEKFNLTAITERDEIIEKHFFDSAFASKFLPPSAMVCDVGSGAGFPGMPLKIVRSDLQLTLVDSLGKRVNFLKELCSLLNLPCRVEHARAEDFSNGPDRETFDVAVSRAVAPLNVLLEYLAALVKVGGKIVAYKTDESEVATCKNACNLLGLRFSSSVDYVLSSSGARRCLLIFDKIRPTPKKFPRGQNKPRKEPL